MYRTQCVLSLLLLYAGLANSFDWEIVISRGSQLQFYNTNGSLTHSAVIPTGWEVRKLIHDPVHNRILFDDIYRIGSFDIASNTTETLYQSIAPHIDLTYDPVLDLFYWSEPYSKLYSASLKTGFNNAVLLKQVISPGNILYMDVDICGGFIYWVSELKNEVKIVRAQFNGSHREIVVSSVKMSSVNIDQQAQKLYWYGLENGFKSTDLNMTNSRRIQQVAPPHSEHTNHQLTFSKDHIYWKICDMHKGNCSIWKIPKNDLDDTRDLLIEPNLFHVNDQFIHAMAAKYNIEDVTRGVQNCDRLKSLLPNNSVSNVSSAESPPCVHGTNVSGESRCECAKGYSCERCEVSVCHNYCFQGDCDISAQGEPKCRCKAGYSGSRCEVNVCQGYCLNDGVCSLNENKEPVCQCTAVYTGSRCEVNACQGYCRNGGVCTLNEKREPVCQCTTVYTGARCEVNACQGYCRNGGVCALNENREPVCQYPAGYEEGRCDVSMSQIKCIQTCIRNTDVTSATDEGVTWTPTSESTVF